MFFLSRNKSTYHYFRPLEVVPICQTMGIFYVKVWLYFLDKLLKVRSGLCQVLLAATLRANHSGVIVCPACSYKEFTQSHRAFGGFWGESTYAHGLALYEGRGSTA